jgi:hypothetical protein
VKDCHLYIGARCPHNVGVNVEEPAAPLLYVGSFV